MKDQKKKVEYYSGHSKEFTRRQLLYNAGLISVASCLNLTNLPSLFASRAFADTSVGAQGLPFVGLDCEGGINLGGNVIVGRDNSGTQSEYSSLDSYLYLGYTSTLHPSKTGMVDKTFGLEFHKTSGILLGMKYVLEGKTVRIGASDVLISSMVDGIVFAYRSTDDSGGNPLNTSIPVVKAGATGKLVKLIGSVGSSNGGFSMTDPLVYDPALRPPVVGNLSSARNLVSLGHLNRQPANYFTASRDASYTTIMNRISNLSKQRLEMMANKNVTPFVKDSIKQALDKSTTFFNKFSEDDLSYTSDAANIDRAFADRSASDNLSLMFPGSNQKPSSDKDTIGAISYLLLNHSQKLNGPLVGAAMIGVSGGDYHDGTAKTGINKDFELGRYIGEMIYYAALKGKNVVFDLFTDGSAICSTSGVTDESLTGQGRVVHHTDSPIQSGSIMLVYRHGATREERPIVKSNANGVQRQIGYFLPGKGGGVDLNANSIANDINLVWRIKMLNYLALMNPTNSASQITAQFEQIYGRITLPPDAKEMIRFLYLG